MRQLIVIVHTSLDGFVAGKNGELTGFEGSEENLEFICHLTRQADAVLLGRNSFLLLNEYWPLRKDHPDATWNELAYSYWFCTAKKYVVSSTLRDKDGVTVLGQGWQETVQQLENGSGKNILVFGSPSLTRALFAAGMIDGYWMFINPVVFGAGIPLFSGGEPFTRFRLMETKIFSNGEVGLHYSRRNEGLPA